MPEEEKVEVTPEVTEATTPEVEIEESEEESPEELKARLAKAEELANNYKIRAEKAEKKVKEVPQTNESGFSIKDTIALSRIDVDDIDDVVEAAKVLKIPVHQAVNHKVVKTILEDKAEQKRTAEATNVTNTRRGPTKLSDDALIANANAGKLPEADEDIQRLFKARTISKTR